MHLPRPRRLLSLLALAPLFCAASPADTAAQVQAARKNAELVQRKIAALGPACVLGSARQPDGDWMQLPHAAPEHNQPFAFVFSGDAAVTTHAFRAALDAKGLRDLEKVEVRDAAGKWNLVHAGAGQDAPRGCEYVWLEQAFNGGTQPVQALRLTFRHGMGTITAANVGVLREGSKR